MKQLLSNTFVRTLLIIVIAGLIGVLAQTWKTVDNVPFCINSAGCNFSMEPKGQITDRNYGYPLTYKQTSTFIPEHNNQGDARYAGYAEATTERQSFSPYNILINSIFWSGVLFTVYRFVSNIMNAKRRNASPDPQVTQTKEL